MSLRIGCSGWSYSDWVGPFYPRDVSSKDFLRLYSSIFDTVEVDSTYYRLPLAHVVSQWKHSTPSGFLFTAKLPKRLTHDQKLEGAGEILPRFYRTMHEFGDKLGPILVQLPPSFKYETGKQRLERLLEAMDSRHRHTIEFRHRSWFKPEIYNLLKNYGVALCWSINQYLTTPADVTSDFIYLRFVGDRTITDFGKVQRDRSEVMKTWTKTLDDVGTTVKDKFVLFNNHFTGFGPASVNEFRRLVGLAQIDWSGLGSLKSAQSRLQEF
ncbi:MAG: DUF72 domain-containing protein [Candidatus Bathyarchaeia archaeon]